MLWEDVDQKKKCVQMFLRSDPEGRKRAETTASVPILVGMRKKYQDM